jgi:hypothetical protein
VNWQEETFGQTGVTRTHNLSLSGGGKKITYDLGYTYNDDKAIVINSAYRRNIVSFKSDYKITSKLKVGVISRYLYQNVYGAGVSDTKGSSYNRLRNAVKYRPYLSTNQEIDDVDPIADPNPGNGLGLVNPLRLASAEYRRKTTESFNFTANATYNITKNFTFTSTYGYTYNSLVDRQFSDSLTPYSIISGAAKPIAGLDTTVTKTITNSNVLLYSVNNFKNKHSFSVLVGQETYDLRTDLHSSLFKNYPTFTPYNAAFIKTNLGIPFTGYPKHSQQRYTNLSFFSRVNYSFEDKYLLSFNVRADAASKFAQGHQWGYFPSGSVAWRVKNETFMQDVSFISDLKFRAGFGKAGNSRIRDYLFLPTFSGDGKFYYGLNNQAVLAYYPVS